MAMRDDPEPGNFPYRLSRQESIKGARLYEVLGLEKSASDDQIKRAYRRLALLYHPDKNVENIPEKTEKFKEINHANSVLSNPQKRRLYDEYGEMGLKLMEQFGDTSFMTLVFKPWFKDWMKEEQMESVITQPTSNNGSGLTTIPPPERPSVISMPPPDDYEESPSIPKRTNYGAVESDF